MSLVDSHAVFESSALAIGLSQDTVNALGLRGWVTHATFAFSVATNPGTDDDQPFIDGVLIPILGREDHVDAPKLRRLFYESHTLTAADLWRKVDANEQDFFCGRRPLPFGGLHLSLPSGPAEIRTTTGSLSALARPTPYQLSHRVASMPMNRRHLESCRLLRLLRGSRPCRQGCPR